MADTKAETPPEQAAPVPDAAPDPVLSLATTDHDVLARTEPSLLGVSVKFSDVVPVPPKDLHPNTKLVTLTIPDPFTHNFTGYVDGVRYDVGPEGADVPASVVDGLVESALTAGVHLTQTPKG
jgi:hypothetical protein